MELDPGICERARRSRDPRFDGRFFVAVTSTGIYCRPVCPARPPLRRNVRYYPTAAAAAEAGFRPCLRCRPESAPGSPAWIGAATTVSRTLRLVSQGALQTRSIESLAGVLGVTPRHLRRLFARHLGASPRAIAGTQRLHFAKKLLDETELSMAQVAAASGFGSVRRFNDAFRSSYGRTPSELRRESAASTDAGQDRWTLRLSYRPPLAWAALVEFLAPRAAPGVEWVEGCRYLRTFRLRGRAGMLDVGPARNGNAVELSVRHPDSRELFGIVARVRSMLDLDADATEIASHLGRDELLAGPVRACPGLRVPGAWDPFELTVRAVLGQQVSVKAATRLAGRLVRRYGERVEGLPLPDEARTFPEPEALLRVDATKLGMPRSRAAAIEHVARAARDGDLVFDGSRSAEDVRRTLTSLPGVGDWTAAYVGMRAVRDPDAFPESDLVLRAALGENGGRVSPSAARRRAEAWRPWRAYAAMHLWRWRTTQ